MGFMNVCPLPFLIIAEIKGDLLWNNMLPLTSAVIHALC